MPLQDAGAIGARSNERGCMGLFALGRVAAGTIVVPDWHGRFYRHTPGWRRFTLWEIEALPAEKRELVIRYGLEVDFGLIAGPVNAAAVTTIDNFINHSCEPNMGYDHEGNVVTARDVEAGEELTIDYGCFAVNFDEEWECGCGSARCRKRIRRDDWVKLAAERRFAMPRFLHSRIAELW